METLMGRPMARWLQHHWQILSLWSLKNLPMLLDCEPPMAGIGQEGMHMILDNVKYPNHTTVTVFEIQSTILNGSTQVAYSSKSGTTTKDFTVCGIGGPSVADRIVGGTDASLGSWPWQASLRYSGSHICGASIISDTWLLSAAHCFETYKDVNLWTVIVGTLSSSRGTGLQVKEIIVHENYGTPAKANDIALLRMAAPILFTQYIRPVCLPNESAVFPNNSSCYITGWGSLVSGGPIASVLQQAEVKIISTAQCSSAAMYGSIINPSMICAGYVNGGIDSCQGDSGGPLVTTQYNGTWYLIGSVSFGTGCALPNKPGVYSRTTFLRTWITQNTGL
ncbi:transmembrane protease serine 11C-like [Pelobates cultripes]|uniref:Transmembrane protease serine 11C-like n=1 Tax=Pelobates cultripes TaxID=61616 RepID=A0AAD1WA86_PELCU|nr:transmembrane protease serine 11C-like [Pelobates cultripes]